MRLLWFDLKGVLARRVLTTRSATHSAVLRKDASSIKVHVTRSATHYGVLRKDASLIGGVRDASLNVWARCT